ncbi:helix-turn-helix domain-containing protein [Propionivibrio sp.]|uniref:helix-turn-helix domain-containing protein n=1 Tax=Propionivibrio sp. TaxID=2212460 RepID=UPI0039E5620A
MVEKKTVTNDLARRLGKEIGSRRKALGWTQDALAERVGVDAETISRFERGAHLPSLPTLERLAIALHVEIGELFSKNTAAKTDEAITLSAWMDELLTEDRQFVLSVARQYCDHLRKKNRS